VTRTTASFNYDFHVIFLDIKNRKKSEDSISLKVLRINPCRKKAAADRGCHSGFWAFKGC
jgi:hypothetical protein